MSDLHKFGAFCISELISYHLRVRGSCVILAQNPPHLATKQLDERVGGNTHEYPTGRWAEGVERFLEGSGGGRGEGGMTPCPGTNRKEGRTM